MSSTDDLLDAASMTTTLLTSKPSPPLSPLTHHFAALAVLILAQLADAKETREPALRGLHDLADAIEKGRILSPHTPREDGAFVGWDGVILDRIGKKLQQVLHAPPPQQVQQQAGAKDAATGIDRGGLQHLADLAVGESEGQSQSQSQGTNGDKVGLGEKEKMGGEGGGSGGIGGVGGAGGEEVNWAGVMRTGYLNLTA